MIKLKSLISENIEQSNTLITIDDITNILSSRFIDDDTRRMLEILHEYYYDEERQKWVTDYINLLNSVIKHLLDIVKKLNVPYFNIKYIKHHLFSQPEFRSNIEEFFPFPIYVSANKNQDGDWADVGILVDFNGKVLEIHEGNDEATSETNSMVNRLLNPNGNPVRIYGAHNTQLIFKIDETGYLPANLYISPNKEHALGYLDIEGTRSGFTGIIDSNAVAHESDVDWRTLDKTKIDKFRWL